MYKLIILIFTACAGVCVGQIVQFGQCNPNLGLVQNFDIDQFVGTWYEIQRTADPQQNADCAQFDITSSNNAINVVHSGVNNNFQEDSRGTATLETGTARLTLNIDKFDGPKDFWVFLTDYTNFAVTYSCENISPTQRSINLWVLGRQRAFTNEPIPAHINTNINQAFGITLNDLQSISHSETACYVLPVINDGAAIILPGQCDANIPVVQNFNVQAFMGTWREISSYYTESSTGTCIKAQYDLGQTGVNVLNSQVINQQLLTITGSASVASTDGSARLRVLLDVGAPQPVEQELWVLATDYTGYAISYSCVNVNSETKRVFSWILSRTRQLSAASQTQVDQVVNAIMDLNYAYYAPTDQSDTGCFYFPEPTGQPVIFPGQCDPNIRAMPNFDAARYLGLWHNIELYPAQFQDGTCSNAYYSLNAQGIVDVFNTQVVNQALDTIVGAAVVVGTDGAAKLEVTFPAGPGQTVTTDYWVLDTDYDSYALVYSCRNIDTESRQVSSWKLSRTKQLTTAANTAINNVMNTIDVLAQQYFTTVDQSVTGCFYFPEPVAGVPVVFPGQCDTNAPVMTTFDLSRFAGSWYEIQAYPKEDETGQCRSHAYTAFSTTQLNLVSSNVDDQFLTETTGRLTSTDSSGRLTLAFTSGTQNIEFPFWIVNTDYTDYALAYSCVNRGSDFRAVYSWKLSRTRQLSTAANTAINAALANNVVLENRYFENIDQSDRACFYLPEIAPGQPIVLPGQCDTTIRGVENFNLAEFAGRWRLVESYFSDHQSGTCNVARYGLTSASSISVSHSQVVNQELRSISGTATLSGTDGTGRLQVVFPQSTFEYIILATDYRNYALAYSCQNIDATQRRIWSWKLSRDNTLSAAAATSINQVINSIEVLNNRYYYTVDRSDNACFYYPEVDPTSIVRFRGVCDPNIPVVMNFDAQRYTGLWHDIESYPEEFQGGTCNNAFYTLRDGGVDVFNTQVINEQLFTIDGRAVLATTDGSAKLEVTFVVDGVSVTTNYWVLATDYESYSLVYSCRPLDDEFVQISTWKLSRSKALTTAANNAINTAMANVRVLEQRYYLQRDQTPAGCFYFPVPVPDTPVVFPGQCDTTVQTVENFDFNRFAGTWHEIQTYPKNEQTGQCINHAYSFVSTSTLNLVSSSVSSQARTLTNSVVSRTTTDGRLTIAISSGTTTINIPFWVLATDYDDYALAYACENRGSDFRAVYSWKLSRTKQLSAAANTAINTAINRVVVLENRYYENVDQSDQACFYLPEIPLGQPVIFPGQCDTSIRGVPNFSISNYQGRWRLIQSYHSNFQSGTCNVARYNLLNALTLSVENSQVIDSSLRTISGTAVVASTDGTGVLRVTFSPSRVYDFTILATDYNSYALLYGCENINTEERRVLSWKLSRDDTLSATAVANINQVVNSIDVLNDRYYYTVDRSEAACFYFPEPEPTTTVRFRGQCNPNIPVVQNFDAQRYMGLWHDIESYPMPFQFGTCPNAFYQIVNGVVNVRNSQVVGQTLATIDGTATVVSTDQSAKLSVTFNVDGELRTTNYWVLATDYVNYALVYSCENHDDEFMDVFSWKLSRTKTLTTASNTAINNVMNTLNILDQRYYVSRDQTPQGCFYFPEPEPGSPVVFPGQCDATISAVPNFNAAQFAGLWHETASYPYEQPGSCVNHRFTAGTANALSLESFNVMNQTLFSSQSTLTPPTDGSGRFTITLNVGGTVRTVPFWILSTDYTDHALAYGCVNIDSDYRQIFSWKLSRTKQPTVAGTTAINNVIATVDVLNERYFENVDQTDDACFFLPVLGPTDPVIFPGQCDTTIPVIRNFDPARYLGRWRLIQSYYTPFQSGTCNEAYYSAGTGGAVVVVNSQVVNQELATITGQAVLATTDGSGKLLVTFPSSNTPSEYWILDTDYDSYALIYTCENLANDQRRVWSWKLSRTNTLTSAANIAINSIVDSIDVLNERYYQNIDRSANGCFYFPTPDANTPVVFPGQCDMNIPVVANFNPVAYAGSWYDVQSYPAPFQRGTCQNALYTLNADGSVRVENTQVVDRLLETWIGSAVLASTDQSAKLDVTFNVDGVDVTTNYWVLATDYTDYALVYSCQNIDAETRSVFSWKLSRTTQLSTSANTAINNVIATIPVLDQRYYLQRSHTADDCFYYPDNNGGDVLLNIPCTADSAVPAITNFNANAYTGTWYEISRYPSGVQEGECISSEYALTGSTYAVSRTTVNNERQNTVSFQATASASGRGIISATIDGIPFNDVYILATDYTSYALAYACRNVGSQSQIFSWKMSRSQSGLSAAANTAINQVVNDQIFLWDGYYETTGQDSNACFHYPVFDQLPSTIDLIGACPTNIRGVANFNAANYLGKWYEIARYPVTAQRGQCNRAVYSLDTAPGSSRVVVSNSEVLDVALRRQEGYASVASTDGSGQLSVEFVIGGVTRTANYYILATDYTSYSLVYSCANLDNGMRRVSSWKLSRTTSLSAQASTAIDTVIASTQGLTPEYYLSTSQSDESCFYIPEVNTLQAPVFRGQCETITGVQNFDVQRYLGWWHEIERYPIDGTLTGECRSSEYYSLGNTYRVSDHRVINNSQFSDTGTVTATTDGRLQRTLSGGAVQDIWVLATDYETYALLYSCENIDSEYRRVWSAKHSKARSLTAAAQTAMAPLIENNRVLYSQFYLPVDQSDETCFHYPPQGPGPIIIPGQCDENIPVVQSFNINDFAGTWYHTERYDDLNDNSCVGSRFTVDEASGNITVLNYAVRNEEFQTVEGSANVEATDGSARISLTFPGEEEGSSVTTNVVVLATDYTNFALVYNCANVNAFRRQVRAWKLSRERTMPATGVTAINNIINQRQELLQDYFKQIEQNDECPEPSSALLVKSSFIVLFVCAILQRLL
ncbi:uncharacterized protein LOC142981240 isoform X2 [Anticarsia gemmatalis]|uniref:uncharacterized protein LOC142981240 isoform X2 n=1 Tax=Anticarsia gemmatalis TaxID=129554 RepID=UPI003F7607A0